MNKQQSTIAVVIALVAVAIFVLVTVPLNLGLDLQGGAQLTLQAQASEEVPTVGEREMEAVLSVVRNRVDGLGVSEPVVQTVGSDRILVQLPGVSDPEQAERVLGGTAQLAFREEQAKGDVEAELDVRRQELLELETERAVAIEEGSPPEAIADLTDQIDSKQDQILASIDQLYAKATLTGKNLDYADVQPAGAADRWDVTLEFDSEGGKKFAELTQSLAGTGRSLGIFLDGRLISAPVVAAQFAETGITGGRAIIEGGFTLEQANTLAVQLRGGALPVPVEIVENRTVGATLGRDSIRRSIYAGIGGLILVLAFMVFYYRLPGAIADIALAVYAVLTLAAFALLGVTLTLPGIAGFILSIGMAVDANVLIFERTREELRAGKSLYRSVESGFYRAFTSIFDSNVTTLIACLALFWLGAGLVKGFALTLGIGVAISMFTAVTCSRSLLFLSLKVPDLKRPELFLPSLAKR